MAKTVLIVDDIDGSPNAETVEFAYDGVSYSIDLAKKNRAAFNKAMKPWIAAATAESSRGRSTRSRGGRGRQNRRSGPDLADVRAWALGEGMEVSERGRVAQSVIDAYNAAH